jgi:hypothetical protein
VGDAHACTKRFGAGVKLNYAPHAARAMNGLIGIGLDGQAGRVVSTVFKFFQAIDQHWHAVGFGEYADDSAHGVRYSFIFWLI